MSTVYLSLGSNKGDRRAHIERAIALVASRYPQARIRRSDWYESEPWGYDSANAYLNIAIALDFDNTAPDQPPGSCMPHQHPGSGMPHQPVGTHHGASATTMPDPFELLHTLQQIEREVGTSPHRNPDGTYRDREIDIDIILIDDLHIDTPELTIPHPRAHLRDFVLIPLLQLLP